MKTPAIKQAFRLKKYPEEMAWLCLPDSEYPEGITDLLRLCASDSQLDEFAEKYKIDAKVVHDVLINFINKAILVEGNSDVKLLGTDKLTTPELRKLHYQLLMRIYHPDINLSPEAKNLAGKITYAYQRLKKTQAVIEINTTRKTSSPRKPPKSFYRATRKAEQSISNLKSAFAAVSAISIMALVAFAGHIYDPANPELAINQAKVTTNKEQLATVDTDGKNTKSKDSETPKFKKASLASAAEKDSTENQLQSLLGNLETAYETGNVNKIKEILANAPEIKNQTEQQISKKLETLFEITSERKMLLYNFNWRSISGKMQGKGKFISRYQLTGEDQWLTREGSAYITAKQTNSELKVTHLELENQSIK